MTIKKVTVFGTGNFGSRLAFHIAFNKIDVTVYDMDYGLLEEARTRFRQLSDYYQNHYDASKEEIEAALANIAYSKDITEAAGNAQLIIEAVAEDIKAKKYFYRELQKSAPKNAFLVTTSEGLDSEMLAKASGRSDKFLPLHFTDDFGENYTLEVIDLPTIRKDVLESTIDFFGSIGMEVTIKHLERQK
ncbi:3-hydroxyacyl-CoA dehydrogenase NAD-binding domain-containing protein [Salinimicrobium terrae]|uniref:3-hydroxyacyl-CoA dehydrogenase NAD-binding domain-containing protein n=1 Tax=Salinimicrobium terrae TaxID=470866 RepID=UPI00041B2284|nr:3-hydroxyacyl-CoA dehydrogenase NAD-binding domain-containing protein [Salinimicrobium terrae]